MSDSVANTKLHREGKLYEVSTIIRRSSAFGDASKFCETMAWLVTGADGRSECVGQWSTFTDDRGRALEMHFEAVRQIVRKGKKTMAKSEHPWCRDVPRDEAVRAAEDAAAVPAIQHRDLPEVVAALTERVARLEAAQAAIGSSDEIARLTAERDAARAESDRLRAAGDAMAEALTWDQSCAYDAATTRGAIRQRIAAWSEARACVAELEGAAAPAANAGGEQQPPRGWLTAKEHRAVAFAAKSLRGHAIAGNLKEIADQLDALLARETPPKVQVPDLDDLEPEERPVWESACREWIAAIRAAGGEVKEVRK